MTTMTERVCKRGMTRCDDCACVRACVRVCVCVCVFGCFWVVFGLFFWLFSECFVIQRLAEMCMTCSKQVFSLIIIVSRHAHRSRRTLF